MELPLVDSHSIEVDASPDAVWRALDGFGVDGGAGGRYARLVGCEDPNGFHGAASPPPTELVLEGRHRFSAYRLTFVVDDLGDGRSRLTAVTNAAFPGAGGAIYCTLVIGTRAHVVMTRRLLRGIGRTATNGS
jgi:hypothetical protein